MKLGTPNKRQNLLLMPAMAIITKETDKISGVETNAKSLMKTLITTTTSLFNLKRRAKTILKVKVHVSEMFPNLPNLLTKKNISPHLIRLNY